MKTNQERHIVVILLMMLVVALGVMLFQSESWDGLIKIFMTRDVLLTDYIAVGGLGSTLLNVIFVTGISLLLMRKQQVAWNGYAYAGIFVMMGFAFFGKNYFNILPIFFGVYLYAKVTGRPYKQYVVMSFFASALAPFTTITINYGFTGLLFGICLAIALGFVVCVVAVNIIRFHNGYLLYNFGFAAGILAIVVTGVLRVFHLDLHSVLVVNEDMFVHWVLVGLVLVICLYLIGNGLYAQRFDWIKYRKLMRMSGRAVTDYYRIFGEGITLVNMGIVGLILLIVSLIVGVPLNGPIVGAILTGIGFAAFGKNPRNIFPVMLGCLVIIFVAQIPFSTTSVITILFVTGIAPIAGEFGILVGVLAGALHFCLVQYTGEWQAGANLYNNGFAAGFIAGIVSSIMDDIVKRKEEL